CVPPVDGTCPKHGATACASPDTPIATPAGHIPIAALATGDLVYSVDGVRAVPIRAVQHTAGSHHHVVRVGLERRGRCAKSAAPPDGRWPNIRRSTSS